MEDEITLNQRTKKYAEVIAKAQWQELNDEEDGSAWDNFASSFRASCIVSAIPAAIEVMKLVSAEKVAAWAEGYTHADNGGSEDENPFELEV